MPASQANKELSKLFADAARILDLKGDNAFKAIAFNKVSNLLDDMSGDVRATYAEGGKAAVATIKGIGKSSAEIIGDWIETGRSADYDELAASVPAGLLELLDVPGLGPKTVKLLWHERGVTSLDELSKAIGDGALEGLKGIGEKKITQIREGIALRHAAGERRSLGTATKAASLILSQLREVEGVERAESAGSVRRGRETIGDLDFLVTTKKGGDAAAILKSFSEFPQFERVLVRGESKCSAVTSDGLQVDCRVVPPASFGAAFVYFTGSTNHNKKLRGLALDRGRTLNEWGVFQKDAWEAAAKKPGDAPTLSPEAGATEEEVYAWLGMAWVPPEMREDRGEVELALKDELPTLIEPADYRGDLHTHTNASDGIGTIEEMALAAKALGYKFLAITDHSKSQAQAGGLDAKRLMKHAAAIRKVNEQIDGIELLVGSECDILSDGSLDYEDAVLAELDWVVASPHVALRQEESKATDRILRAIDNPYVNVIGHPTGRLVNKRAGLPLDVAAIFKRAAETVTALEINASYQRLDLSDVHARGALDAGCVLCIDTDAHSPDGLGKLVGGFLTARRAWATKKDVVNCLTLAQVRAFVAKKRP